MPLVSKRREEYMKEVVTVVVKISEDSSVIIPRKDWERPEWRKAFLTKLPEVDERKVNEEFAKA